jgi:hypothetical protein
VTETPSFTIINNMVEVVRALGYVGLLIGILYGNYKGIWMWGNDYRKLERERDEWKAIALQHAGIAERATRLLPGAQP